MEIEKVQKSDQHDYWFGGTSLMRKAIAFGAPQSRKVVPEGGHD